jgi:hypothetical protein
MRVLLTGASGYCGQFVADALLQQRHELAVFPAQSHKNQQNIPRVTCCSERKVFAAAVAFKRAAIRKLLCVTCQQERGSNDRRCDHLCMGVEGKVAPPSKSYTATACRICIMSAQLRSTHTDLILTHLNVHIVSKLACSRWMVRD